MNYILRNHVNEINKMVETIIIESKGDIFEVFISMYDYMVKECMEKNEFHFYKRIFENIRTSEDTIFSINPQIYHPKDLITYYKDIDKTRLVVKDENDFRLMIRMLYAITRKAMVCVFRYDSKENARRDYIKEIEFLKYGLLKKESEDK